MDRDRPLLLWIKSSKARERTDERSEGASSSSGIEDELRPSNRSVKTLLLSRLSSFLPATLI